MNRNNVETDTVVSAPEPAWGNADYNFDHQWPEKKEIFQFDPNPKIEH